MYAMYAPRQIPCVCVSTLGNEALSDSDYDYVKPVNWLSIYLTK